MKQLLFFPALLILWMNNQSHSQVQTRYIQPITIHPGYASTDDSIVTLYNPTVNSNQKLLVFLPGTGAQTKHYLKFPSLAANLGYHCISLSYPNGYPTVAMSCAGNADADCYYHIRQEVCYGTDVSPDVTVDTLNSIHMRLINTLNYLTNTYPSENWDQFMNNGEPAWHLIAISGHSQGGGHALYLAKTKTCERMLMFAGADDYSNYYSSPANWTYNPGLTPVNHFYSFLHRNDDVWDYSKQFAVVQATGMTANGDDSTLVDNLVAPYGYSHCLYTEVPPNFPNIYSAEHNGMVVDFYTPSDGNGTPLYQPVWEYMLTDETAGMTNYLDKNQFLIGPNPGDGLLFLFTSGQEQINNLVVYDQQGQTIFLEDNVFPDEPIDLRFLTNGMYILQISTSNQTARQRLLIVH